MLAPTTTAQPLRLMAGLPTLGISPTAQNRSASRRLMIDQTVCNNARAVSVRIVAFARWLLNLSDMDSPSPRGSYFERKLKEARITCGRSLLHPVDMPAEKADPPCLSVTGFLSPAVAARDGPVLPRRVTAGRLLVFLSYVVAM